MDENFVDVELGKALTIDGASVQILRMREPTVADQITASEMKGSQATQEITLIANLCDVAPSDIKRLSLRDYKKLQEAFLGFTE